MVTIPRDRIACAVDACLASLREAAGRGADLLLVRNGIALGRPLLGSHREKVAACLKSGLSVYVAGAPLEAHAEIGPNAQLIRALGLTATRSFGRTAGLQNGLAASCDLSRDDLAERVERLCGPVHVLPAGPTHLKQVGVVAGRCEDFAAEAAAAMFDAVITGETTHAGAIDAEDHGLNVIIAGYHSTMSLGVKALAEAAADRLGLEWFFVAHAAGM